MNANLERMALRWIREANALDRRAWKAFWPWNHARLRREAEIYRDHGRRLLFLIGVDPNTDPG